MQYTVACAQKYASHINFVLKCKQLQFYFVILETEKFKAIFQKENNRQICGVEGSTCLLYINERGTGVDCMLPADTNVHAYKHIVFKRIYHVPIAFDSCPHLVCLHALPVAACVFVYVCQCVCLSVSVSKWIQSNQR